MTANRPLYKKLKQREYREAPDHYKPLTPRPLTITVHKDGRAALRSAGIIPGRGPGAAQDGTSASGADAGEGGTPSANTSTGGKGGGGKFGGGAGASSASNGAGGGAGGLSWAHPDAEFVDLVKGEGTIPGGINDDNYIAGKGEGAVGSTTGTPNTGTLGYVIFEF